MYKTALHSQDGFTLVELLIVVAIIVIVTAGATPSFTSYIRNQGVKQAQEQLKSDMRNIQNKALTGALSDQSISGNPVQYWGIKFSTGAGGGSKRYEYFISATNNTCPGSFASGQLQGYSELAPDLVVRVSSATCLYFSMANGAINSSPSGATQMIVGYSGSTSSGSCRRVLFNSNGLIYSGTSVLCT